MNDCRKYMMLFRPKLIKNVFFLRMEYEEQSEELDYLKEKTGELKKMLRILEYASHNQNQLEEVKEVINNKNISITDASFRRVFINLINPKKIVRSKPSPISTFNFIKENINLSNYKRENNNFKIDENTQAHELKSILKKKNIKLSNWKKSKLIEQAEFGFYLDMYKVRCNNYEKSLQTDFKISSSYARKLRWLGNLAHNYLAFRSLSVSLVKLYSLKASIDKLLTEDEYVKHKNYLKTLENPPPYRMINNYV